MKAKQYLSSQDVYDLIKLNTFANVIKRFHEHWQQYLTKQEQKDLKTATTIVQKSWNSIIDRTKPNDCEKIYKKNEQFQIVCVDEYQRKQINDRYSEMLDKVHSQDNYYRLCEIVLDMNCANCQKQDKDCRLYKEFCDNLVPEPSGHEEFGRCKYAYEYIEK